MNKGETTIAEVNKKEFKAPTDESIRLLNEFQDKASTNIIEKVIVNNNLVDGVAILFGDRMMGTRTLKVRFIINGQEFSFSKELGRELDANITIGSGNALKDYIKENFYTYFADELVKQFWENEKEVTKELYNIRYGNR